MWWVGRLAGRRHILKPLVILKPWVNTCLRTNNVKLCFKRTVFGILNDFTKYAQFLLISLYTYITLNLYDIIVMTM